jgi:hypothetical protein
LLIDAVKKNKDAMAVLNTSLVGDSMGIYISKSYSTAWPRGVTWKVWLALNQRFQPQGINMWIEFNNELNKISMGRRSDPGLMLDKLKALVNHYRSMGLTVHTSQVLARALVIAPLDYSVGLTAEKH